MPPAVVRMDVFSCGHRWKCGCCEAVRFFTCLWLLLCNEVSCKQLASPKLPQVPQQLQKPSFSFSKISGLSALSPSAALLDAASSQFVVEPVTTRNVTTQIGQTTYLHCIVDKLDDKTIRYPQLVDEGLYECQISSDPPASHYVYLKVLVPKTKIMGGSNFYVSAGSAVNLTCVITECPEPPAFVFWYHDSRMINYDASRGDISVQKAGNDTAVSRLHIKNAQPTDSGNYSCCPSNADSASIFVHVLRGEKHAAVQNDATSTSRSSRFCSSLNIVAILECLLLISLRSMCVR